MIKLFIRHKAADGKWVTDSTSQSWENVNDLFDAEVKVGKKTVTMAEWLLSQKSGYFYVADVDETEEEFTCPF